MPRYIIDGRASIAGSATLPLVSIYSSATVNPRVREVHVFNTTSTGAFDVALCRLTTTGTRGSALTIGSLDSSAVAASCTAYAGHTVAPTLTNLGPGKAMGAAVGDGVIWTFNNDVGITVPLGTSNGIGLYVSSGTGQVCRYTILWDE